MKKYLLILFIFLAGFIFAGADASNCAVFHPEAVKINKTADISNGDAFLDYENYVIKENIKNIRNNNEQKNSNNVQSVKTVSFENNNKYITFEKQYSLISVENTEQKFKDIKFKLHPRAP